MTAQPFDLDTPNQDFRLFIGTVEDDKDPLKQGRVRVIIPGLLEPGKWANVAMLGSPFNRGVFAVPAVGGQVIVGLIGADYAQPVVLGGIAPPALPEGFRADTEVADLPKFVIAENEDMVAIMGKTGTNAPYFAIFTRDGTPLMSFIMDTDRKLVELKAPTALSIVCDGLVNIKASSIQLGNRIVEQNGRPI
jgi:hypothetical protein